MNAFRQITRVLIAALIGNTAIAADERAVDLSKLPAPVARAVDFAGEIQPILAKSCCACHGRDRQESGLRLDVKQRALSGGDSGPVIVPQRSGESRLIHLVAGIDPKSERMPPEGEGEPLTREQITLLRSWIDQGADWPEPAAGSESAAITSKHWSFQSIVRPAPPTPNDQAWIRNPIDAFVLAKLDRESTTPSPEAERRTLLRRIYLDLIGLPPTPREVDAFINDSAPDAYERVVDRLLESPHYGERWGRHWLDVARYADSDGFERDFGRPYAWRYRDWVIDALNRDMPFDVFTVQQLAGDLLVAGDPEFEPAARTATGFHRNTLVNKEAGADVEEDRTKRTIDRTNTLGGVWLGLTVGCANCHSHKFDPVSQREYFGLYAFFNSIEEVDVSVTPGENYFEKLDLTPPESDEEVREVAADQDRPPSPLRPRTPKSSAPLATKRGELRDREKNSLKLAQAVAELSKPRKTFVHLRGDFLSPGPRVEPHTPEVLPPLEARGAKPDRLDLARWLCDTANPLTARVIANRIWQTYFGRGLVATNDDFGTQGAAPSHPELLDWLAGEFRDSGWRLKRLHRLMVTSATYRQSSVVRPELTDRDPYNTWLARQNPLRVEAEIVRDLALAASGLLNSTIGGPSIRPPQPEGIADLSHPYAGGWEETTGAQQYRRGLYVWFQRTSPYPSQLTFDAPDGSLACTCRQRSNTPLQALTLLNDVVFVGCAEALARRMMREVPVENDSASDIVELRLRRGFLICLARPPNPDELLVLRRLYDKTFHARGDGSSRETAAYTAVARAILNLDEFIVRD